MLRARRQTWDFQGSGLWMWHPVIPSWEASLYWVSAAEGWVRSPGWGKGPHLKVFRAVFPLFIKNVCEGFFLELFGVFYAIKILPKFCLTATWCGVSLCKIEADAREAFCLLGSRILSKAMTNKNWIGVTLIN